MNARQDRRLAVVTGASSGIGFDLLIAAEDDELDRAASELNAIAPSVEKVKVDLSRPVDALALNAGIGAGGAFATETDLDKELRLIDLNELKDTEVTVTSLMPGPTDTEFYERAEMMHRKMAEPRTAEEARP